MIGRLPNQQQRSALRAWIEEQALFDETGDAFDEGCKQTLDDLSVFLDPLHATMNAAANCQRTD